MFHSSSFRHEKYRVRNNSGSKYTLHKQLPSLDSKISAVDTDSEYSSSSSSPTYSTVSSPSSTVSFSANTISTLPTSVLASERVARKPSSPQKKKRTQNYTSNRTSNQVYSCPRPLTFPFHNDDHFLPIAEADPRDVARICPPAERAYSIQSKDSIPDAESSYSRNSSILSSIQHGTVSTIRSIFQLPNSLSNMQFSQTNDNQNHKYQPLERIEIKQGTVQSLRDFFTRHDTSEQYKPRTESQLETNTQSDQSESLYSRASRAIFGSSKQDQLSYNEEDNTDEINEPKKTFTSKIKRFSVRVISNLLPTKESKHESSQQPSQQPSQEPLKNQDSKKEPSKVGKLWKSFKSLWSSKRSKVGPIAI